MEKHLKHLKHEWLSNIRCETSAVRDPSIFVSVVWKDMVEHKKFLETGPPSMPTKFVTVVSIHLYELEQ